MMKRQSTIGNTLNSLTLNKIVVVRSLPGLGDLLCCVPALRALRGAFPQAQVVMIGLPSAKSVAQRFHQYVNELVEFPGFPGIPEVQFSSRRTIAFLSEMQRAEFDLAVQLHGNGSCTNSFMQLIGASRNAGFFPVGSVCPDASYFLPYPDDIPEVWRHLRLMEFLGIPLQGADLEFPLWESDWQELNTIARKQPFHLHNYVCIHPGASTLERCWPYQNFAIVADTLAAQGWQIVLTGTKSEVELTNAIIKAMRFPALNLAGETSLGALAALLKNSQLLICNDTGVSHLADALHVRSVVVFSKSDMLRWAPLNGQRHRTVGVHSEEDCWLDQDLWLSGIPCPTKRSASIESVLVEAMDLLQQEFAYAS